MADVDKYFALFDGESDVIKGLEWSTFFNRLARDPPPLVERTGFQALQLAELVFFGDVVNFDVGYSG
ncbi:MAG: hypothetical protein ABIR84_00140 [Candidatus Nitrotoga sp.]